MSHAEFETQLCNLRSSLERYAYSLTMNKDEADDLLQETIYKALRYRDSFAEDTNLLAWTFTIMKNIFINNYRKNSRLSKNYDIRKDTTLLERQIETAIMNPDSAYSVKEIQKAISELPDEYRITFNMHTEGYKYKEIAEALNIPIGSVKSRIFIARRKLMARLREYE
ncbi:MAG TPA: sigma-70 family RNA polymerase sigma factor [Salinivirgaceae bacterium]|nr:sigma-70 family RNA polymerase sigma factor [Salinivirgaceae bacterium]